MDLRRVSRLTGNLDLLNIGNVPASVFSALVGATLGTVNETNIGCCLVTAGSQVNCSSSSTPICGC